MIRPAVPADVTNLVALIGELAEYERARDQVEVDEELLGSALFDERPIAFAQVATVGEEIAGMVIYFPIFSTWTGRGGLHVEDLFVREEFRGRGIGKALLTSLGRLAVERGYARMDWAVLDWNSPAKDFYRSLGAVFLEDWTTCRLSGSALGRLAGGSVPGELGSGPPPG